MSLLKINLFIGLIAIGLFFSCEEAPIVVHKITATQINVDDNAITDAVIDEFISPYRNHINTVLDSTLAYAPETLSKNDGEFNTSIGNFMADVVYAQANPVFKKRTGKDIDFVLLNHGGIRAVISKGNVSTRTAYQVMPFENKIVVLELSSEKVEAMGHYLASRKKAHPLSAQVNICLDSDYKLKKFTIHQKPITKNATYHIATSDYLMEGGDGMHFFKSPIRVIKMDYSIRNALIDHLKKVDTIFATKDDRFIKTD